MGNNKMICPISQDACIGPNCEWWIETAKGCAVGVVACLIVAEKCNFQFQKSPLERINELLAQLKED